VNVKKMNTVGKYVAAHLTIYRDGSVSIASLPSQEMVTVEVERKDSDLGSVIVSVDVSIRNFGHGVRLEPM
jgi:hypothetical protein